MKLEDIRIQDIIDMYWLTYRKNWNWWEYSLYEWWQLTSWWRFNTNKNKAFDNTWKWRPSWYPLHFVMWFNRCSKEEAIEILKEKFYLTNNRKRNVRKSNIRF